MTRGSLFPLSLPSVPVCTRISDAAVRLTMNTSTFTVGTYAFCVAADLPDETPVANTFAVVVLDSRSHVVHANFHIPGKELLAPNEAPFAPPTIGWSSSEADVVATMTFSLSINSGGGKWIKSLRVRLPDRFWHETDKVETDTNLKEFVRLQDLSEQQAVGLTLKDKSILPQGTYRWQFGVRVPWSLPAINIWFLDVDCGDFEISFPLPGFELGQIPPRVEIIQSLAFAAGGILIALMQV
jgi:hypothetical protein